MSNYNNSNNRKNNKGRNNRTEKQPKVNPNIIKSLLYLPGELDENLTNEILEVLESAKFDKVSVPLSTYKCLVDNSADVNDNKIVTIGYINKYDSDENEFTVTIFNKFLEVFKEYKNTAVELQYTTNKDGSLRTITKFNLVPVVFEDEELTTQE